MGSEHSLTAAVRVRAEPTEVLRTRAVDRRLFGKFTEHLGQNVYGGAWAQLLSNPGFAPASAWPDRSALLQRLQEAGPGLGLPGLASALVDDLPPWWLATGDLRLRREERRGRPVLRLLSARGGGGWLVTPVHLPVQRTCRYRLELRLRSDVPLGVSLRHGGREPWAGAELPPAPAWTTHELALPGSADAALPPPGTPFHLALEPLGAGCVEVRSCLLLPDDHLEGWDPEVVGFLRAARLPLLRFPGGNFASGYHWRDGVGPAEDRPVLPNPAWPEVEWNHVGTDEWLRLCELVGCEPLICVNAGDGTPEEAAAWVQYCNAAPDTPLGAWRALNGHPAPYGVRLWEVGNELYGSWQVGATDAAGYAGRYRRFAEAMRAADPAIRLIANGDSAAWNRTLVHAAATEVQALSHHCLYGGFPADADPRRVYLEHMAFTPAYRQLWDELAEPLREVGRAPRLAITEQQVFTRGPDLPSNATLTEAIWTASILNEAIRSDGLVELLTHSALINHGGGLRKECGVVYAQPVWWTTHLYAEAPGPLYRLELDVDSPEFSVRGYRLRTAAAAPYLDAVGLADSSGAVLYFFLVNRHPDCALRVRLTLPAGGSAFRFAERQTLSGESFMARNTRTDPDQVRPVAQHHPWNAAETVHLPPCSLVRLRLGGERGAERGGTPTH